MTGIWKFELVDGQCVTHIAACKLTEKQWDHMERARQLFMEPVHHARMKERQAKEYAAFLHRENINEHEVEIEGVICAIRTRGPENEAYSGYVGDAERPMIKVSLCVSTKPRQHKLWNVQIFSERLMGSFPANPYDMLRNSRGGGITFKSIEAAFKAGIKAQRSMK